MVIYAARRTRTSLRRPRNFLACLSLLSLTRGERAASSLSFPLSARLFLSLSLSLSRDTLDHKRRSLGTCIGFLSTIIGSVACAIGRLSLIFTIISSQRRASKRASSIGTRRMGDEFKFPIFSDRCLVIKDKSYKRSLFVDALCP